MRWKKIAATLFLGLLCTVFLSGQSLYELAQKEKARRAKLQGKTSRVVTNADLGSSGKTARLSSRPAEPSPKKQPPQSPSSSSSSNPKVVLSRADQQRIRGDVTEDSQPVDQQIDQRDSSSGSLKYATEVLSSNEMVQNPDLALKQPDSQYAEINLYGVLDLLLTARNGLGPDIAIFSRLSGEETQREGGLEEGGIPSQSLSFDYVEGFWYGVLAMNDKGEWVAIGKGAGSNGPEEFDLGSLASTTKIRIMFHPLSNTCSSVKALRSTPKEIRFGIDAIAVLH